MGKMFEIGYLVQIPKVVSRTERPRELYIEIFIWGKDKLFIYFMILWNWVEGVSYLGDN